MATGFKNGNPGCPCCGTPSGGPSYPLPGCPCTAVPAALNLHVGVIVTNPLFLSAVPSPILYSARPADLVGYTSSLIGWYSPTTFTSNSGAYVFRYWFGCSQGVYFVQMLPTVNSPTGYGEKITVMTWLVGLPRNTCTPFSLANGGIQGSIFAQQQLVLDAT